MNPLAMDGGRANPFAGGKVVATGVRHEEYSMQTAERGSPEWSVSSGMLMEFARCPHRWLAGYASDETKQTEWGSLIDCLALTPARFNDDFAICPETYPDSKTGEPKPWNWNATLCKEWKKERGGQTVVKHETHQQAVNAVSILYGKQSTREVLECSDKQVMVVSEYRDAETKLVIPVRILVDLRPRAGTPCWGSTLGDLKTSAHAGAGWRRKVFEQNYHVQAAFYLDVYCAAAGEDRPEFFHLVQESFPPWEPVRKILSAEFIELGRWRYQDALARYAACLKSGVWPGYVDDEIIQPEPWMLT